MKKNLEQEKLVDDLLNGKAILYSMSDIQKILSISRSTLNRWIKNGEDIMLTTSIQHNKNYYIAYKNMFDDGDLITTFPSPDLYIGNSPRWSKETVKKWILDSQKNK